MNRESLHKSLQWELGLLTYCLQAEKKKTGIQLIRVTDANGNTYERYYDFDKGEFAANPNKDAPPEELKKYRGLRNKDIKDSIASENYLYTEISDEDGEAIWKAMEGQIEGLNPEQTADTKAVLQHLTITNNGWKGGMKILGDQVNLGFEDGLKSIQSNIDKGLSAVGKGLNSLWQGLNQKPIKDGILLAGALIGSVASAVKGYGIIGGGLEGLATRSLLAGVGLEFAALALGGFFVGQAIKMLVLPAIAEYRKNHPPLTESQRKDAETKRALARQEEPKFNNALKEIGSLAKDLSGANEDTEAFFTGMTYFQVGVAETGIDKVSRGNARSKRNAKKTDTGNPLVDAFNSAQNFGSTLTGQKKGLDAKGTLAQAYETLEKKIENQELLLKDQEQAEALLTRLNSIEKSLNEQEEVLFQVSLDHIYTPRQEKKKQKAKANREAAIDSINQMREDISAQRLNVCVGMMMESENIREFDSRSKIDQLKSKGKQIGTTLIPVPGTKTGSEMFNKKLQLREAKTDFYLKEIARRKIEIPPSPPSEANPEPTPRNAYEYQDDYEMYLNQLESFKELLDILPPDSERVQETRQRYQEMLEQGEKEYGRLAEVKEAYEKDPKIQQLKQEYNDLKERNEKILAEINEVSLTYKEKIDKLVAEGEATTKDVRHAKYRSKTEGVF